MQKAKMPIMAVVLAISLTLAGAGIAFAAAAYGSQSNLSTGGKTFHGQSYVQTSKSLAKGGERVCTVGATMPAGYGGIQPVVIVSGSTALAGKWSYNSSNLASGVWYSGTVSQAANAGKTAYAQGYFAGYDGKTYYSRQSGKSPNQTVS